MLEVRKECRVEFRRSSHGETRSREDKRGKPPQRKQGTIRVSSTHEEWGAGGERKRQTEGGEGWRRRRRSGEGWEEEGRKIIILVIRAGCGSGGLTCTVLSTGLTLLSTVIHQINMLILNNIFIRIYNYFSPQLSPTVFLSFSLESFLRLSHNPRFFHDVY